MLIIVYLIDIASDIKSKKEHTPAPLKRGIGSVVKNKRTYQPYPCPSQEGNWFCGKK